jgi:hypothetical protein
MSMAHFLRILAAFLSLALISAGAADDGRWYAGDYSFSDELGGFRIVSVRGTGTRDDPIEIQENLVSTDPITLVIRSRNPSMVESAFHLRIVTVNESGLAWIGFDFELQEIRGKPSDFYDGLSFGQLDPEPDLISSDRFTHFKDEFEPSDRLSFDTGHVDPREHASFGFFVTDVTPVPEFYLIENPRIPST